MLGKKVRIHQIPHCELMPEELSVFISVCRDELQERYERILLWRLQGYEFEKIEIEEECSICRR